MDEDDRLRGVLAAILLLIIVGGISDILLDKPASWLSIHVIFEVVMVAGALTISTALWLGWWRARAESLRLREALEGFGSAVERRFDAWHLTRAERDVALLLLKGYSHKHIAAHSNRSERTIRQHAVALYQKAGVTSRAELAGLFLEALQDQPPAIISVSR